MLCVRILIWKSFRILAFIQEAGRSSLQKCFKECLSTGSPNGQFILFSIAIFVFLYVNITSLYVTM